MHGICKLLRSNLGADLSPGSVQQRRASGARESPQCGNNWQAQYARLHAGILKSEPSKQRFAVYKARVNGLGDRLTSAVTIFYYAMLSGADDFHTKGAFQMIHHLVY